MCHDGGGDGHGEEEIGCCKKGSAICSKDFTVDKKTRYLLIVLQLLFNLQPTQQD